MALISQEPTPKRGHNAAKVRLAGLEDAARVARLLSETSLVTSEEVEAQLEGGGALLLEDRSGALLCALLWLETGRGWTLRQPAVLTKYHHQELDRWVLTKVEALAIQRNIPTLEMQLEDESLLPYYARMGYQRKEGGTLLSKRVGGTWQYK